MDGVVTDDNDVFLFQGRHVYRHIFANDKYVEEYNMKDLEAEMGLDRWAPAQQRLKMMDSTIFTYDI